MKNLILYFSVLTIILSSCYDSKKNNADLIIRNGIVVTIDSTGHIYPKGTVVIKANKIIDIGYDSVLSEKYHADNIIDAQGKIVMPGFVNAHTHIAMSLFRGLADDLKLQDWLHKYIFPAETKFVDSSMITIGSELAMVEMLHSGITCFNDMYFYEDLTAQMCCKIGMRAILSESLIDFPVPNAKNYKESMDYTRGLEEKYKGNELVTIGVAAHSPYTCSPNLLRKAKKLADEFHVPFHIHVSETSWEVDTITAQYDKTPIEYLDSIGVLSNNVIAAHCVWLSPKDIRIIARRGVGVAHNPECNMKISSGVAPIPELLKAHAEVGLGTDGPASNNNLNMIQEMHTMALIHKLNKMNPTVVPAEQVVRTATIGSAKVLGLDKKIGSLEIGKYADIILIDTNNANTTPMYNVYSNLVYASLGSEVSDVIINGKVVMKNKKILTTNEEIVMSSANKFAEKLKKELLDKK